MNAFCHIQKRRGGVEEKFRGVLKVRDKISEMRLAAGPAATARLSSLVMTFQEPEVFLSLTSTT